MPGYRKDQVRCAPCLKKGLRSRPEPISLTRTGYNDYVKLQCLQCGHTYTTTSRAAQLAANVNGLIMVTKMDEEAEATVSVKDLKKILTKMIDCDHEDGEEGFWDALRRCKGIASRVLNQLPK